jgi:hypothetical protein
VIGVKEQAKGLVAVALDRDEPSGVVDVELRMRVQEARVTVTDAGGTLRVEGRARLAFYRRTNAARDRH